MEPIIPLDAPCSVKNVGQRPFRDDYGNRPYTIAPGATMMVPYHAMVYWFGDPRAVNIGPSDQRHTQYRSLEVERLQVKYGMNSAPFYADHHVVDNETIDYLDGRHPNLPCVEIYDLMNERLISVIDDPEGTHLAPPANVSADAATTAEALAAMQQQIARLTQRLMEQDPEAAQVLIAPTFPAGVAGVEAGDGKLSVDEIAANVNLETRDPVADPDDPDAQAGDDLSPKERALAARHKAVKA